MQDSPFMAIFRGELSGFFMSARALHFIPMLMFGIFLISWTYSVAPPYAAVMVIVFCTLEPQCNNMLFRTPNELEVLTMFPVTWREIILAKNVAAALLILFGIVVSSACLYFFSPAVIGLSSLIDGMLYAGTVLFPLLLYGNSRSTENPRRKCGWQYTDFIEMLWMAIVLLVVSIPYAFLSSQFDVRAISILYTASWGYYWYRYGIPRDARRVDEELITICSRA